MFGLMWFDRDPRTSLAQKIKAAAAYHKAKYKRDPEIVLVPLAQAGQVEAAERETRLTVRAKRYVLPNHLWIGTEQPAPLYYPQNVEPAG